MRFHDIIVMPWYCNEVVLVSPRFQCNDYYVTGFMETVPNRTLEVTR